MPPERHEGIYLQDILKAVNKITGLTKDMDFRMFCNDERTVDAVLYNFTISVLISRLYGKPSVTICLRSPIC